MENGFGKIMWGLFFSVFHINFGSIPILPTFVGWLIIVSGTKLVAEDWETRGMNQAVIYARLVTITSLLSQLFTWFSFESLWTSYMLVLFSIFELLYVFYLLEGSIEFFNLVGEESTSKHYQMVQRVYSILLIVNTLLSCIGITIKSQGIMSIVTIFSFILFFWLLLILNNLKNEQKEIPSQNLVS